ncbi:MAG: methionyl-tRNA formyltransferase [Planctomycetaceae bacterium]
MKLVFLGTAEFARESLEALLRARFPPALVVTPPPRRRKRGAAPEPTPVQLRAAEAGIEVFPVEDVNLPDSLARLCAARADLFAVAEFGQILSEELLAIPRAGAINVHASLLPRHRGATPVAAAILAGDAETGVTIQRVVKRLDAGPVLSRRAVAITEEEDAGQLLSRLARLGGELLVEVVAAFAAGRPPVAMAQEEAEATFCRRFSSADAILDWSLPALDLARRVRALSPKPGVRTHLLREPPLALGIRRCRVVGGTGPPGQVMAVSRDQLDVGTGAGLLRILELLPAGRRLLSAAEFLNGWQVRPGERFGVAN